MLTLYIYNTDTKKIVAHIHGKDNAICEAMAENEYGDTDTYGWTYSPAIGAVDGLIDNEED